MSSKISPKKDEKITASPTKKDDKASLSIMTRHQSAVMNTRQLRNKEVSRRKISAITQLLLGPNKEKSHFNKRKSPKDKVKLKKSPKKQRTVKVSTLALQAKSEAKSVGKKRKIIAQPKGAKPAKAVCKESSTLSVQELIELCEEQSLDDEDFLEILTCESPVWWEQPDNQYYCEDAITTSEETRYFKELFKPQVKTEVTVTPSTTNIKIPEFKQTDDKFMKKRNKLENLLGNIKNKLADTPKQEKKNTENVIDNNEYIPEKPQVMEETEDKDKTFEKNIMENEKARKVQTPSESTSSSDDMFFGFQNEDILKDLENMDIPIKEDKTTHHESSESTELDPVENMEIEDNNSNDNKNMNDTVSGNKINAENVNSTDHIIENNILNSNSFLEINKHVKDEPKEDDSCVDVETKTPENTESLESITNTNTSVKDVNSGTESSLEKSSSSNNPVKIYYIDATTSKNDKMITTNDETLLSNENNHESTTVSEENKISLNSSTIDNQTTESDNNIQSGDNDENTRKIVKVDRIYVKDLKERKKRKKNQKQKESTNNEKNIKSAVNPKRVNKNRLMAVYKIITDKQYNQNCTKTTKNEVESAPIIINNILNSSKGLKTFFNNYTSSNKQQNANPVIIDDKNNESSTLDNESFTENGKNCNEIDAEEKESNEISQNLSNDEANDEEIIDINKVDSKEGLTQINEIKMNEINENKTNDEKCADLKDNINDKCGDCDSIDTETSFNIKSEVTNAKYCLKCSSIFESETCSYCAKLTKLNQENQTQQS